MARRCELSLICELCNLPSEYYDSIPDARIEGYTKAEAGYRLQPLCWLHAKNRRFINTSRVGVLLRCEKEGVARVDRDRASGMCVCPYCGRLYFRHPANSQYPFLQQLCDGSVVKL